MSARSSRSNVDATLFGSSRSRKLQRSGQRTVGDPVQQPIVITRAELSRMHASTVIQNDAEKRAAREAQRVAKEEKMRAAKMRREMMELKEKQRKAALPKSKLEIQRMQDRKDIKKQAAEQMQEREDDVKSMNAMMQYSLTVAIRDAQLEEMNLLQRKKRLEEKRAGILMEIARIKQVQKYIDRENSVRTKAREDRKHIEYQIKQREAQKKEKVAAKLREQQRMKDRMAELDAIDDERKTVKRAQAKVLLNDILEDNKRQIAHRKRMRELDIAEDLRIHNYQLQLQEKQKRLEEEKEAQAKERTIKIAKMRAAQKKAQDSQAALDAVRAKRAAEDNERRARARDLKEAKEKAAAIKELQEFRHMQHVANEQAAAAAEEINRKEFYANAATRKKQLAKTREKLRVDEGKRHEHKKWLIEDISRREALVKKKQQDFVKLGIAADEEKEKHLAHLNSIKAKKIDSLREAGVPERYLSELGHFDPRKVLLADYKRGV